MKGGLIEALCLPLEPNLIRMGTMRELQENLNILWTR